MVTCFNQISENWGWEVSWRTWAASNWSCSWFWGINGRMPFVHKTFWAKHVHHASSVSEHQLPCPSGNRLTASSMMLTTKMLSQKQAYMNCVHNSLASSDRSGGFGLGLQEFCLRVFHNVGLPFEDPIVWGSEREILRAVITYGFHSPRTIYTTAAGPSKRVPDVRRRIYVCAHRGLEVRDLGYQLRCSR